MFFSIKCLPKFHPHLLIYLTRIPHVEEPNLCIFSPKFLCKDEIINNIKDVWMVKPSKPTKSWMNISYLNKNISKCIIYIKSHLWRTTVMLKSTPTGVKNYDASA